MLIINRFLVTGAVALAPNVLAISLRGDAAQTVEQMCVNVREAIKHLNIAENTTRYQKRLVLTLKRQPLEVYQEPTSFLTYKLTLL